MDDDMEIEPIFEARVVDPEYEFDAPFFFDFTREESAVELHAVENWFRNAPSYPPSPFVAKLDWIDQNSSQNEAGCSSDYIAHIDYGVEAVEEEDCEAMHTRVLSNSQSCGTQDPNLQPGLAKDLHSEFLTYNSLNKTTSITQPRTKTSTLMKPTASILAKQNRPPNRLPNSLGHRDGIPCNSSAVESQAVKKQKLEYGLVRKVNEPKPQCDFLHKKPKKNPNIDKVSAQVKMRLTIPREPNFATAKRVHKIRDLNESKNETASEHGFKARPLNRKILEAPLFPLPKRSTPKLPEFQEFHLKTSERAMQHASSDLPSLPNYSAFHKEIEHSISHYATEIGKKEYKRSSVLATQKMDNFSNVFAFKARPINKPILSSKGDLGVLRCTKRDVTVPVEFTLHTEKRAQQKPPVDLFSKLSIAPDTQKTEKLQLPFPHPNSALLKGSKENKLPPLEREHKMTPRIKDACK